MAWTLLDVFLSIVLIGFILVVSVCIGLFIWAVISSLFRKKGGGSW